MQSRGLAYMAASAVGFSAMSALVKVASRTLPTGEIVFVRAVITLAFSYVMVRRAGLSPSGHQTGKLVLRGVFGFAALAGLYLSLARLPLADATVLQHTTPVLTALLAWRLLGEPIGWPVALATGCGLAGVVLVAHPSGGAADPLGVAFALGGALCSSMSYVTVRQLAATEAPLVIVLYFPLVAAPASLPWALADFVWPTAREWLLLVGIGIATQVGQVMLTMGLALERAGRALAIAYLQVVFAMLWQLGLFGQLPTYATIAGASLIVLGALAVSTSPKRS